MGIVLWGLFNPHLFLTRKECNLRKEKLLGDSLCGAQTPQRVNGSVQICYMSVFISLYRDKRELTECITEQIIRNSGYFLFVILDSIMLYSIIYMYRCTS